MLHIGAISRNVVQANFSGLFTVQPIVDGYQTSHRIIIGCTRSKNQINFPLRSDNDGALSTNESGNPCRGLGLLGLLAPDLWLRLCCGLADVREGNSLCPVTI